MQCEGPQRATSVQGDGKADATEEPRTERTEKWAWDWAFSKSRLRLKRGLCHTPFFSLYHLPSLFSHLPHASPFRKNSTFGDWESRLSILAPPLMSCVILSKFLTSLSFLKCKTGTDISTCLRGLLTRIQWINIVSICNSAQYMESTLYCLILLYHLSLQVFPSPSF